MTEALGKLLDWVGTWSGEETLAASAWAPATTASGALAYSLAVDGAVLIEDYNQTRADGGTFTSHGVFTVDESSGTVSWYLFDSYGYPPVAAVGTWDEGILTLEKTTPRGVAVHEFELSEGVLRHDIRTKMTGEDDFAPFMTATYTRVD